MWLLAVLQLLPHPEEVPGLRVNRQLDQGELQKLAGGHYAPALSHQGHTVCAKK